MANILILTSKTGGGHLSLAEALRDRLDGAHTVRIVEALSPLVVWHYTFVSRYALWSWAASFRASNTPASALLTHRLCAVLFARGLGGLLAQARPDAVLSTHPFLSYEVTRAMRQSGRVTPFAMLFTDPNGVHQAWLTERRATATFAPTRETFDQALQTGFAPERVHLTGWPVRRQFTDALEPAGGASRARAELLAGLGLEPERFTVFLQGGAEGTAGFARAAKSLLAVDGLQVILAAGTNRRVLNAFAGQPRIRPIPFTTHIAPYMAAADVIAGKAGPNTLLEAVTLGKPFIATTFIPGQEAVNLEFIQRHGLGEAALTAREQSELARRLLAEPGRLADMRDRLAAYREWNASATESIRPLVERVLAGG